MNPLKTTAILTALFLSGCAAPSLPVATANAPSPEASVQNASLKAQSREIRTKIVERKQKIAIFEVMLTDVERRAARSEVSLSYLPNTNIVSEVEPRRANNERLSVAVRPSPVAAAAAKPFTKKRSMRKPLVKKKRIRQI